MSRELTTVGRYVSVLSINVGQLLLGYTNGDSFAIKGDSDGFLIQVITYEYNTLLSGGRTQKRFDLKPIADSYFGTAAI